MGLLQASLCLLLVVGELHAEFSNPYVAVNEGNQCEDYDFFIISTIDKEVNISIEKHITPSPSCKVVWGDGHKSSIELEEPLENIAHTYDKFGIYSMYVECKYLNITTRCPRLLTECLEDEDILDNVFQSFDTPLVFFSHKPIVIKSYMKLSEIFCGLPEIWWNVSRLINGQNTGAVPISQIGYSELHLSAGFLVIGTYIVRLHVAFPHKTQYHGSIDFIIIKVVHPELVTHIEGGERLHIPSTGNWIVNANLSNDPAEGYASEELHTEWSLVYHLRDYTYVQRFIIHHPNVPFPSDGVVRQIQNGTDYALLINASSIPVYSDVFVMFTMSRDSRMSSAIQILRTAPDVIPIGIKCIYNCHIGRERIFYIDKIELEVTLPVNASTDSLTYDWSILVWSPDDGYFISLTTPYTLKTDRVSQGFGISSLPEQGLIYRLSVMVFSASYYGWAVLIRKAHTLPYGGSCHIGGVTEVQSCRDWLTLTCASWAVYPFSNPYLTYTVIQRTEGAVVYEEPILQTRSQRSHVILKVGNQDDYYNTSLVIQVTNVFNDYEDVVIYVLLPVWVPPAPRVLNTDGNILDLNAEGNADIGTLEDAKLEIDEMRPNPATLAIQQVMENLTEVIENIVNNASGRLQSDKFFSSLIVNAFTNLIHKEQFINTESTISIAVIGEPVGLNALNTNYSSEDESAQIEIAAGEIYSMAQATANSAVPDDLTQNRPVIDILNGLMQIDEMLTVLNQNISLKDSKLSPMERAYLYLKMQQSLRYNTDKKKEACKQAAKTAVNLAREILAKYPICATCSNRDNSIQQLVHKNTGVNISGDTIATKSQQSTFRLNGLSKALRNRSLDESGTVDVSAFEFDQNVYMYDNDGTSGYVTSKVLRLDVKYSGQQIDPDEITFDQFVQTPNATRVTPEVNEDDASMFMYHNFIYQKNTDHVCIIIKPVYNTTVDNITTDQNETVNITIITTYDVYFSFEAPPTILDYNFKITLTEDDDWMECILPTKMKKHTGITYFAVSLPGYKQNVDYDLTIITVGCLTWEEKTSMWHTDKCWVGYVHVSVLVYDAYVL
ncbi:hypothetical protein ACF0H5_019236 [Mactra antiquata]